MTAPAESVVLVEGYDDRDFWRGLLLRLGCTPQKDAPRSHHGQSPAFTFGTPSGALIRVLPYRQQAAIPTVAEGAELSAITRLKLKERSHKPMRRLILAPDADTHPTLETARKSVRELVNAACPGAVEDEHGDFAIDGGSLLVSTVFVDAEAARNGEGGLPVGTPAQPALEQLVCAALCQVHPERGEAVARWLSGRPSPLGKDHKAHAWSFYAGWSTAHGTGDFYGSLWRDDDVATALERLLRAQGAWRVMSSLLGP